MLLDAFDKSIFMHKSKNFV